MKKIFVLFMLVLLVGQFEAVSAATKIKDEVVYFFDELSNIQDEWDTAKIKDYTKIYDENDEYYGSIYRVYSNNVQQGYIVYIEGHGVVQASFEGTDPVIEILGKVYLVYPGVYMSKNDFAEYKETDEFLNRTEVNGYGNGYAWYASISGATYTIEEDFDYDISTITVPNLDYNYEEFIYYNAIKGLIADTPNYVNDIIYMGCSSFSAAMMIAY